MIIRYFLTIILCLSLFTPNMTARNAQLERMQVSCARMLCVMVAVGVVVSPSKVLASGLLMS